MPRIKNLKNLNVLYFPFSVLTPIGNTIKISEIVCQLRQNGEEISDESLSHISLLSHKHVIPMGTYFVDEIKEMAALEKVALK